MDCDFDKLIEAIQSIFHRQDSRCVDVSADNHGLSDHADRKSAGVEEEEGVDFQLQFHHRQQLRLQTLSNLEDEVLEVTQEAGFDLNFAATEERAMCIKVLLDVEEYGSLLSFLRCAFLESSSVSQFERQMLSYGHSMT